MDNSIFRKRFYNKQCTDKYFLIRDNKVVGTILEMWTKASTSINIYGLEDMLKSYREPITVTGYGLNRFNEAMKNYFLKYGLSVNDEELRLLESGRYQEYFKEYGITVIN